MNTRLSRLAFVVVSVLFLGTCDSLPAKGPQGSSGYSEHSRAEMSVIINESTADFSSQEVQKSDCALIDSGGDIHFERRKQLLPNNPTTEVLKSRLNEEKLKELSDILNSTIVRGLPEFTPPSTPISVTQFHYFSVEMLQGQSSRKLGYFEWDGKASPNSSPASMPVNVKEGWKASETALQPLAKWFHELQGLQWITSGKAATHCSTPSHKNNL